MNFLPVNAYNRADRHVPACCGSWRDWRPLSPHQSPACRPAGPSSGPASVSFLPSSSAPCASSCNSVIQTMLQHSSVNTKRKGPETSFNVKLIFLKEDWSVESFHPIHSLFFKCSISMHGCCHVSNELFHIFALDNFDGSITLTHKEVDLPVTLFKAVLFFICYSQSRARKVLNSS